MCGGIRRIHVEETPVVGNGGIGVPSARLAKARHALKERGERIERDRSVSGGTCVVIAPRHDVLEREIARDVRVIRVERAGSLEGGDRLADLPSLIVNLAAKGV